MSTKYQRVAPGQRDPRNADLHNTLVEIAQEYDAARSTSQKGIGVGSRPFRILNVTADTLPRYAVVGIGAPITSFADDGTEFLDTTGAESADPGVSAPFAILQEGIYASTIGDAVVSGVSNCKVSISDVSHTFAAPAAADYDALASQADYGPARILSSEIPTPTQLNGAIDAVVTSWVVDSSDTWPDIDDLGEFVATSGTEQVLVTAITGKTWTVQRGYGGTTAATHADNAGVTFTSGTLWCRIGFDGSRGFTATGGTITTDGGTATGPDYTFANGVSGVRPNFSAAGSTVTLDIPDANFPLSGTSVTNGLVNQDSQRFGGQKMFDSCIFLDIGGGVPFTAPQPNVPAFGDHYYWFAEANPSGDSSYNVISAYNNGYTTYNGGYLQNLVLATVFDNSVVRNNAVACLGIDGASFGANGRPVFIISGTYGVDGSGDPVPHQAPCFGVGYGSGRLLGVWGSLPDGSEVSGGLITAIGSGGGTVTSVGLTAGTGGISVSGGPITSSGSITVSLDADLAALAALSGTNTIYYRSAANTWTAVAIGDNLSFSGGTLTTSATIDFSGVTWLKLPAGTSPTVDAAGKIAIDTNTDNSNITQGSIVFHDGTVKQYVASADALPTSDGMVLAYDGINKKYYWKAVPGDGMFFLIPRGGIVIGGSYATSYEYEVTPSGGVVIGGTAGVSWVYDAPGEYTLTLDADADLFLQCWGAGGAGSTGIAGIPGGGGGYAEYTATFPAGSYTIHVPAGGDDQSGSRDSASGAWVSDGAPDDYLYAENGSNGPTFGGNGGGATAGNVGDTTYAGGNAGMSSVLAGAGGGGGAGSTGAGGNGGNASGATPGTGGAAGGADGGAGGDGGAETVDGSPGASIGGGGGSGGADAASGGAGAAGRVSIQFV